MTKSLYLLCAIAFLFSSCTKDKSPAKNNLFKISFAPILYDASVPGWQQILGGNATITCNVKSADTLTTLSSITKSLNLDNSNNYTQQLIGGKYDVNLKTTSTAIADVFIRFTASVTNYTVNKDETINLPATTTDGVITITNTYIDTTQTPTFTQTGTTAPINLGKTNGYYFLYVKGGISGRLTFTQATTGDLFLKDITITAQNQYDISPKPNAARNVVVNTIPFELKRALFKVNLSH